MRKSFMKVASTLFPNAIANIAYQKLNNPQVLKLREHELACLDKSKKEILKFENFDIQLYRWGNPADELILLVHGWEGQAGNFSDFVEKLLENNYYIVAFDGPSHGFSSKGETNLFQYQRLVEHLIGHFQPKKLVSHSFGGVVTTLSLTGNLDFAVDKYLLFTVPDKFSQRIDGVSAQIGITDKVKHILINRIEKETQEKVTELSVSNNVKSMNVKKGLIIHDKNDRIIPINQAKDIVNNWQNAELLEVEGTGHFRILRTETVLEKGIEFLRDE